MSVELHLEIASDTILTLAFIERDLTGDGRLEELRVTGTGSSVDSLDATFTIESSGQTVFETTLRPFTRTVGYGSRVLSESEHRTRLDEFDDWFFGAEKFLRPEEFVAWLHRSAPARASQIPGRDCC